MAYRMAALLIAAAMVLGQYLENQTYLQLSPLGFLVVGCVTVVGAFLLLHLPSISNLVLGEPQTYSLPSTAAPPAVPAVSTTPTAAELDAVGLHAD